MYESLFSLAGTLVLPGWFLLVLFPGWRYTTRVIASVLLPGILAIGYAALFLSQIEALDFSAFNTLAGVRSLFQNDALLLAGWIHYLAFDMFVGSWEVRDARTLSISHVLVIPCLFFTFILGPVGFLAYLLLRLALRGKWTIEGAAPDAAVSG